MKTKERKLKAIYKALDLLRVANENIKECKKLLNSKTDVFDKASDKVSDIAFKLLKESAKIVKETDNEAQSKKE